MRTIAISRNPYLHREGAVVTREFDIEILLHPRKGHGVILRSPFQIAVLALVLFLGVSFGEAAAIMKESDTARQIMPHAAGRPGILVALAQQPQDAILEAVWRKYAGRSRLIAAGLRRLAPEDAEARLELMRNLNELTRSFRQDAARQILNSTRDEQEEVASQLRALGANGIQRLTIINAVLASIPRESSGQIVQRLRMNPSVSVVLHSDDLAGTISAQGGTSGARSFWEHGFSGMRSSVAVLDTGIDDGHFLFRPMRIETKVFLDFAVSERNCFQEKSVDAKDRVGHGTQVAGIIGGRPLFGRFDGGIAPNLGTLYAVKVAHYSGCNVKESRFNAMDLIAGLNWVLTETDARSVNISLNLRARSTASANDAARYVDEWIGTRSSLWGAVIVVSAGNECTYDDTNPEFVKSPGNGYNVITVGAASVEGALWVSSCFGPERSGRWKPDLVASGYRITSTAPGFQFKTSSGTSFSAPHVTGAAALLDEAGVSDPLARKAVLINSTSQIGRVMGPAAWSRGVGWGILDLERAWSERDFVNLLSIDSAPAGFGVACFRIDQPDEFRATIVWDASLGESGVSLAHVSFILHGASHVIHESNPDWAGNVKSVWGPADTGIRYLKVLVRGSAESQRIAVAASQSISEIPCPRGI